MNKSLIIAAIAAAASMTACNHKAGSIAAPKGDMKALLETGSFKSSCLNDADKKSSQQEKIAFSEGSVVLETRTFAKADCEGDSQITSADTRGYSVKSSTASTIVLDVNKKNEQVIDHEALGFANKMREKDKSVQADGALASNPQETWSITLVNKGQGIEVENTPVGTAGAPGGIVGAEVMTKTYLR